MTQKDEEKAKRKVAKQKVYPWECVTLIRKERTTLDFVVKDPTELMALLHVTYSEINGIDVIDEEIHVH